jgi:predicted DNA-binding transcriptional regulator YafY
MQNQEMILSFVLSFGNKCKVLEPEWLRDKVKDTLRKELELYE